MAIKVEAVGGLIRLTRPDNVSYIDPATGKECYLSASTYGTAPGEDLSLVEGKQRFERGTLWLTVEEAATVLVNPKAHAGVLDQAKEQRKKIAAAKIAELQSQINKLQGNV